MVRTLLSPRMIALHVLGAVATTAAVLLGLWQYDAWQANRELAARDLAGERPVPLDSVLGPDAVFPNDQVGRPVRVDGSWVPDSTMLVTDRELGGRDGVWVVTPVAVCGQAAACDTAPAVLVVRGWAPSADDVPAAADLPRGPVRVTGSLQPGEGTGRPDANPGDRLLPELRIASAIQHVDQDLYGGYVVSRTADSSLEPVTPEALPAPGSFTSLRNFLYALEWWVFAGFAGFLWWRWVRDELDRVAAVRPGPEGDAGNSPDAPEGVAADAEIASSP